MAESEPAKVRVLFLCTGNSCRSQMAEGWARRLVGDAIEPYSAGVAPKGLDRRAVAVMAEAGVDISEQPSEHVDDLLLRLAERGEAFDWVVTVCDSARESCPVFPGRARVLHRSFDDPPHVVADADSEEEALAVYRRVRDEIRGFVAELPAILDAVGR